MAAPTTKLVLEYDGTGFAGWAAQPGLRTVQGVLEGALQRLRGGDPAPLTVCGRTDAGVHALAQVASYAGEPVPVRGLNALLPSDVAVTACGRAPDGFDARRWASSRRYVYRLRTRAARSAFDAGRVLHWPRPVDFDALHACAAALVGEHDFTAFTPTETQHVRFRRIVSAAAWRPGDDGLLEFSVEADAFLRHMNRVLVGTMLEVAGGRRSVEDFAGLLDGAPRPQAGPTAPPHGLYFAGATFAGGPVPWVSQDGDGQAGAVHSDS